MSREWRRLTRADAASEKRQRCGDSMDDMEALVGRWQMDPPPKPGKAAPQAVLALPIGATIVSWAQLRSSGATQSCVRSMAS